MFYGPRYSRSVKRLALPSRCSGRATDGSRCSPPQFAKGAYLSVSAWKGAADNAFKNYRLFQCLPLVEPLYRDIEAPV